MVPASEVKVQCARSFLPLAQGGTSFFDRFVAALARNRLAHEIPLPLRVEIKLEEK